MPRPTRHFLPLSLLATAAAAGCASIRVTDPPRTASEQFLLSVAAQRAVAQLDFEGLRGRRIWMETSYFAASEQAFVLGELRAQLLLNGIQLMQSRGDAEIVLEVRSGGVGIDRQDSLVGLPSLALATEDSGIGIPFATPELAISKNIQQHGVASVAFVAYWADTGEVVARSGPYIGRALRDDWWFLGAGPNTVGNIPTVVAPE